MKTSAETLEPGVVIAERFAIERYLGEGLPGAVYLATQHPLDRTVVVKVIEQGSEDTRSELRFVREAEALSRLSHPACAHVFEFGTWKGLHYLVLRHVPGTELSKAMQFGQRWETLEALNIAIDLADGLAHAHAAEVVHRNVSPERIVLSNERDRRTYGHLVDFGLAHTGDVELDTTAGHAPVGAPGYLAPERIHGESGGPRADVFSLGVVLFEMLTGQHPFRRRTGAETVLATARERVPPLDRVKPPVATTPALTKAVQIATQPRADDRFRDGRELTKALRAARLSVFDPRLVRASFTVRDGVVTLDEVFEARIDDPTAEVPSPVLADPEPIENTLQTLVTRPAWVSALLIALLVASAVTAVCAAGIGVGIVGWFGG